MSTTKDQGQFRAASIGDCARLWSTLTTDYIPALRVELTPHHEPNGTPYILVELVDYSTAGGEYDMARSVWARRVFRSEVYLISYPQLFDLLIDGHKVIELFFSTGVDNRPRP